MSTKFCWPLISLVDGDRMQSWHWNCNEISFLLRIILHLAPGMLTVKEKESGGPGFSRKCPPKVHAMTRWARRPPVRCFTDGGREQEWYLEFDKMCNATVIMTALFVYQHALRTRSWAERWRLQLNFNANRLKRQLAKTDDMAISIQRLTGFDSLKAHTFFPCLLFPQ